MKQQVTRLSPHQNAKVFGVLMAITSLVFVIPFFLFSLVFSAGPTRFMVLLMPFVYLIVAYIGVAIGCLLYNLAFKFIGGIEYESEPSA